MASRAKITESVLKLLEDPLRKRPDLESLRKVRVALEENGVMFLAATDYFGEGVRFATPSEERRTTDFFRCGRAMLDLSIDEMASISKVGRITIGRIERDKLSRPPEGSIKKLREVLFERGVTILPEEADVGGGVRFRAPGFSSSR
ncbi:hypothetical protein U8P68_17125 [Rhizobium ruizarguesonis]|uniref:hypothetical protein n=1 Tax=Rhizobium leguminosarum TaxID=384 RepID=UPI0010E079C5|nr:hypothetical protein [Rhizobium leguminosarum]TBF57604.1 hypothetical protein ELG87_14770 [Rhizobium leguminosarum]WSH56568.1 hypothetical protein U8P68_17125 [Rhizobium ruizarguesonis]